MPRKPSLEFLIQKSIWALSDSGGTSKTCYTRRDIQGAARASPQGNWPLTWFVCCHFWLWDQAPVGKVDVYGIIRIEYR